MSRLKVLELATVSRKGKSSNQALTFPGNDQKEKEKTSMLPLREARQRRPHQH